ncbi:hypothetical protein HY933_04215 [Candidatus Falkowbacteria bacterium]|nr:hypothetical protein [Candidatus Falkowbacteria bacterium]
MIKLSPPKINTLVFLIIILLIVAMLGWSVYFIYQYVYRTIILVPDLESLKLKTSVSAVRIDLFDAIQTKLQQKTADRSTNWSTIHNPF